jgi:5-bromo-4-chloroindolyl phosphate hydrolysis protein
VSRLLRQGRAWAPVLKSAVLFVLPLPLVLAFVVALITGEFVRFTAISGSLAAICAAGFFTWRALVAEARYFLGERLDLPVVPFKIVGAFFTAIAAVLAASAGGYGLVGMLVFAILAAVGYVSFYGRDQERRRFKVPAVTGVDVNAVTEQLKQAYGRLQGIDAAARSIAVPEFVERLRRIIDIGRQILAEIERDPRDAARARRFLNLYLDSAERVTTEYARTHRQIRNRPLEENFRQLLIEMENTFETQHQKLLENDLMSLDVDIEVLNARLKHEGV